MVEVNQLASGVEDVGDVIFVPAFGGLLAPYWRSVGLQKKIKKGLDKNLE